MKQTLLFFDNFKFRGNTSKIDDYFKYKHETLYVRQINRDLRVKTQFS